MHFGKLECLHVPIIEAEVDSQHITVRGKLSKWHSKKRYPKVFPQSQGIDSMNLKKNNCLLDKSWNWRRRCSHTALKPGDISRERKEAKYPEGESYNVLGN